MREEAVEYLTPHVKDYYSNADLAWLVVESWDDDEVKHYVELCRAGLVKRVMDEVQKPKGNISELPPISEAMDKMMAPLDNDGQP